VPNDAIYGSRMALFRFGMHFASVTYPGVTTAGLFARISEVAQAAEQSGFDSIWLPDHVLQNPLGGGTAAPMFEAYTLLGALAAVTERAKLGSLVSPVTFRSPALLAKAIASLDVISGGRAVLGIGAAWDAGEHTAYGIEFPEVAERQDRLEEAVQICRALLTEDAPSFSGKYYSVVEAHNSPRPLQASVPIMVAGGGERRTLRTAARYADACNVFGDPEAIRHKLEVLARHCDEAGRDVAEITTTAALFPPETVDELVTAVGERLEAGLDGVIFLSKDTPDPETVAAWGAALRSEFA
jgi:F420-dependent oxidoreductase-like protein